MTAEDAGTWLDAECEVLAAAVRKATFPRARRAAARQLLQSAFRLRSDPEGTPAFQPDLVELAERVEALLRDTGEAQPLRLPRVLAAPFDPIRLRAAQRTSPFALRADRYLAVGVRFDARVEWMWQRCKRSSEGPRREKSAQERAAKEFAGEDLEFVWGRKRT